jgi:hypothetical protein
MMLPLLKKVVLISASQKSTISGLSRLFCALLLTAPAFGSPATTTTLSITSGGAQVTTVATKSVVTLTATVIAGAGALTGGIVNFCDATAPSCGDIHLLGTSHLTSAGTAVLRFVPGIGSHNYKAVFAGTNNYASSISTVTTLIVTLATGASPVPATTTTNLVKGAGAGTYSLTATVSESGSSNGYPTGTVSFLDTSNQSKTLGTAALGGGLPGVNLANSQTVMFDESTAFLKADLNGDGVPDLVECTSEGKIETFFGNGDGTFTAGPLSAPVITFPQQFLNSSIPMALGDFNGDGKIDLILPNKQQSPGAIITLLGNGDGTFTQAPLSTAAGISANDIVVGDFNGDGNEDVAITDSTSFRIMLGNGDGTFTQVSQNGQINANGQSAIAVASIETTDFNGDGKTDLLVTSTSYMNSSNSFNAVGVVLLGNGDGSFTQAPDLPITFLHQGSSVDGIFLADFNNDGKVDLAGLTNLGGPAVLLGNGDGTFTTVITNPGSTSQLVGVADFDGDGNADLASSPQSSSPTIFTIQLGKGDGTFVPAVQSLPVSKQIGSFVFGDLNGDGFADLTFTTPLYESGYQVVGGGYGVYLSQPTRSTTTTVSGINVTGAGAHQVLASYPGDSNYSSSVSAAVELVAASATTLSLSVPVSKTAYGQEVDLTATLLPYSYLDGTSNGETISFFNSDALLGTTRLSNGVATLPVLTLPVGVSSLYATFNGDSALDPSSSNTISYTVFPQTNLIFAVPSHTYGDPPFTVTATSNSAGAITYFVASGSASVSGSTVTLTGAGTLDLLASQAATNNYLAAQTVAEIAVLKAPLGITANNASRMFGGTNPIFTGTVIGTINGDALTETFTTPAGAASSVGTYPIIPSATGANAGSYNVIAANGTLTVSQAGTTTKITLSGQGPTLTATVASLTSGIPTGSVSFYDGQTLIGAGTLVSGVTTYTGGSLPAGDSTLTAKYSGDINFMQSTSSPALALSITPSSTALTVGQAGSVMDTVTILPVAGYTGTVQLSCSNLPPLTICAFQPSSLAFAAATGLANVSVTIQTSVAAQAVVSPKNQTTILAAILWIPGLFVATITRRKHKIRLPMNNFLLFSLICVIAAHLTACSGSSTPSSSGSANPTNPAGQTPTGAYTVQVVATGSNGLTQATNVSLTVQ